MVKQPTMLGVPHHHIKRAVVWYLVLLLAGVIAIYGVRWWNNRQCDDAVSCASKLDIKEYSLGAEVTEVNADDNELKVKTGWVSDGKFVYYERTVKLTADAKVLSVTKDGTVPVLNQNPIDYIRVGDKITIMGAGNPYTVTTLTATKIEVQR